MLRQLLLDIQSLPGAISHRRPHDSRRYRRWRALEIKRGGDGCTTRSEAESSEVAVNETAYFTVRKQPADHYEAAMMNSPATHET